MVDTEFVVNEVFNCVKGFPNKRSGTIKIHTERGELESIRVISRVAQKRKTKSSPIDRDTIIEWIQGFISRVRFGTLYIFLEGPNVTDIEEEHSAFIFKKGKNIT